MTISEEQLKEDRVMVERIEIINGMSNEELRERGYDEQFKSREVIQAYKTALAVLPVYISEVERLRADLKCTEELYAGLQEDNRKLQAENAELKKAGRKVVDLRNSLTGAPIAIEELRRLIVK